MQFISESNAVKKESYDSDAPNLDSTQKDSGPDLSRLATVGFSSDFYILKNAIKTILQLRKPATATLLNGYRQTWKATHNHYQRFSDVRPKDERRPTIIDLANQNRVLEKVNGWKIYHLSTQMEDLVNLKQFVHCILLRLIECALAGRTRTVCVRPTDGSSEIH